MPACLPWSSFWTSNGTVIPSQSPSRPEATGMDISVTAAKAQLTELVRRAEAGEENRAHPSRQTAVRLVRPRAA